jgi:hypothetical protein
MKVMVLVQRALFSRALKILLLLPRASAAVDPR